MQIYQIKILGNYVVCIVKQLCRMFCWLLVLCAMPEKISQGRTSVSAFVRQFASNLRKFTISKMKGRNPSELLCCKAKLWKINLRMALTNCMQYVHLPPLCFPPCFKPILWIWHHLPHPGSEKLPTVSVGTGTGHWIVLSGSISIVISGFSSIAADG